MKKETKFKLLKFAALIGVVALFWILDIGGGAGRGAPLQEPRQTMDEPGRATPGRIAEPHVEPVRAAPAEATPVQATPARPEPATPVQAKPAQPAPIKPAPQTAAPATPAPKQNAPLRAAQARDDSAVRQTQPEETAYYGRDEVAAYIRRTGGKLPPNFITKDQARELGWQGGPLEPYAPGKAIGGDRFGNYDGKLPRGNYRECDIGTRGKPRGAKRLVFTTDGRNIYSPDDHYETFTKLGTVRQ